MSATKSVMSNVSSSRAVTRLSVQVFVFSMLILMLSSLLSRGWLFAAGLLPAWQLLLLLWLLLLLLLLLLPPCCWPRWWWGERTDSVLLVCKLTPVVALPFTSRRLGARRPPPPPPPPPGLITERPPPPPPSPSLKNIFHSSVQQRYTNFAFSNSICRAKRFWGTHLGIMERYNKEVDRFDWNRGMSYEFECFSSMNSWEKMRWFLFIA